MTRPIAPPFARALMLSAFVLSSVLTAQAQAGLGGDWVYAGGSAEQAQRERALDQAAQGFPGPFRAQARRRLEQQFTPAPSLDIAVRGDRVELRGARGTLALTVGGPATTVAGPNGRGEAQATREGGHLVITLRGERGTRKTTYRLASGGERLVLAIEVRGQRRETPLRYEATYRRR